MPPGIVFRQAENGNFHETIAPMSSAPPPPTKPPEPEKAKISWVAMLLAFLLFAVVVVAIDFLALGAFLPVVILGGVLFAIAGFHYLVWGWWLGNILRNAEEETKDKHE